MQIFISYSSVDEKKVNIIDKDFQSIGINLIRDTRDLKPKGSIKEFMARVRSTDFVMMIISDSFIKSYYCMYEVLELLEEPRFSERLLPILLPNANIFNTKGHRDYIIYWEKILEQENAQTKGMKEFSNSEGIMADLNHYRNIRNNIDQFISILRDMKIWNFDHLRNEKYNSMLSYLGVEEVDNYTDILEIQTLADPEEQEVELHDFLIKNPNHKLALFHKAFLAAEQGKYIVAKNFYERVLKLDAQNESVHFNLGLCLVQLQESVQAIKHFKKAININPENTQAHLQLGLLFMAGNKKLKAESSFLKTINLDEDIFEAHSNLGVLYRDYFKDYKKAIVYLENAGKLNPDNISLVLNLAYAYELIGDDKKAFSQYSLAHDLEPYNQNVLRKLLDYQNKNAAYAKTENEPQFQPSKKITPPSKQVTEPEYLEIRTPIVGTFMSAKDYDGITYSGASYYSDGYPNLDNAKIIEGTEYVKVGDYVTEGKVIGIVEAMGLYNEIESDVEGYIVKKVAVDGRVEYDEVLYLVDPRKPEPKPKPHFIKAPILGTFHRSGINIVDSNPYNYSTHSNAFGPQDGKPYVQKGDFVKKGQVVCIIEAMAMGNEIESEVEGYIDEIRVEDDSPVEYDQVLFTVIPKRKE